MVMRFNGFCDNHFSFSERCFFKPHQYIDVENTVITQYKKIEIRTKMIASEAKRVRSYSGSSTP